MAIDEALRQKRSERQELEDQMQSLKSTNSLLTTAIAAREKVIDLTQLLLLTQQEMADANNDTAEKAREVETLQAKRSAEVDCDGSVSHVSSAACSSPLSPQQWAPRLAASLEDARFRGQGICGPLLGGSQPGISSDATASGSCLVDADRDNISGIQLPCCQSSFHLAGGCALC